MNSLMVVKLTCLLNINHETLKVIRRRYCRQKTVREPLFVRLSGSLLSQHSVYSMDRGVFICWIAPMDHAFCYKGASNALAYPVSSTYP